MDDPTRKAYATVTPPLGHRLLRPGEKAQQGDLKHIHGAWIEHEGGQVQVKLYSIPFARRE